MTSKKNPPGGMTRRAVLKSSVGASMVVASGCPACGPDELMDAGAPGDDAGLTGRDAGGGDASGTGDAGTPIDSGPPDASALDSGPTDAGAPDAAGTDGGANDAGPEDDAGPDEDAGPTPNHPAEYALNAAFDLGVSAGLDTADAPWAWTRVAFDDVMPALTLAVWPAGDPEAVVEYAVEATDVSALGDASRIFMPVPNTLPGAVYGYCFVVNDGGTLSRSDVGRFEAPEMPGTAAPVKFVVSSCTHHNATSQNVLREAADEAKVSAMILLGDTVYADGSSTYAEYQAYWTDALAEDAYRTTRNQSLVLATWDDHEVTNNFNPETIVVSQLQAARQAFFDHQPLPRHPDAPERIWRSHRFGATVEVFMLDCRSERLPSTRMDSDAQYISPEQMEWLKMGLLQSPCRFKLIVNSVPITDLPLSFNTDKWEGYPSARNDILSYIEDNALEGVAWVAGDVHFAASGRVGKAGDLGENQIEVIVGPAAQLAPNPQGALCVAPQFDYGQAVRNYGTLEFDPVSGELHVRHIGNNGNVLSDLTYAL